MAQLFDFAVVTIFARECLEGAIIIGEYRTIILRSEGSLQEGIRKEEALREITLSALYATALALLVIAAVAIPLAVLSQNLDEGTSKIIEGLSKIVAGICLLQLSLKLPKFLGIYGSCKKKKKKRNDEELEEPVGCVAKFNRKIGACCEGTKRHILNCFSSTLNLCGRKPDAATTDEEAPHEHSESAEEEESGKLTIRSIRFNVAWNIWREVAECGVFLIPFFLSGEGLVAIPLSAVVGSIVGLLLGYGIYVANQRFKNRNGLCIFAVLLLVVLSAGLFTGGCHNLEKQLGATPQVWSLDGDFWSVDRLPMTVLKPFGYNDSRTVLEIVCFWGWLALAGLLHYRKYRVAPKPQHQAPLDGSAEAQEETASEKDKPRKQTSSLGDDGATLETGDSSIDDDTAKARLHNGADTDEDAASASSLETSGYQPGVEVATTGIRRTSSDVSTEGKRQRENDITVADFNC